MPLPFQSTLPVWGATELHEVLALIEVFQSTLPVWGATCRTEGVADMTVFQSTLPVWGATLSIGMVMDLFLISIHAPRVGSDYYTVNLYHAAEPFQSTLPVWGATFTEFRRDLHTCISIHAPRVGSDQGGHMTGQEIYISIHAPRVGSDSNAGLYMDAHHFNPRSPCGERLRKTIISIPFSGKNRYVFSENDSAAQNRAGFCAIFHILMWISGANLPEKFCSLQVRTK